MSASFQFTMLPDGIGCLTFDMPGEKVNKLSLPVLEELEKNLDSVAKNSEIKALLIKSGKDDVFIAGADLHSFKPMFDNPSVADTMITTGHRIFNKLERLPFPTFALINGACLGGGLELALACTSRIATDHPKTLLGLPEVTLGIIPGWGGTQRLPKLVGLLEGLPMVLSGKPVKASKAMKIHLVDTLVAPEFAQAKAIEFIRSFLTPSGKSQVFNRRKRKGFNHLLLEKNPLGRNFVFYKAEKDLLSKTKGHYPAPVAALKLIKDTYSLPLQSGLAKEIETIRTNLSKNFSNAKNLIHLFFVQEALKKNPGMPLEAKPHSVKYTGVIGAGIMGSGIAWLLSSKDYFVRFKDIDWKAIGKGYSTAYNLYSKMVKDKRLKLTEANLKFHRMTGTTDYSGFKNADLVIEAAVEDLNLKHAIFKDLEEIIRPDAILATNTSSLTIAEISKPLKHPERFLGLHFFNPPNRMPLVEVVAGEKTTPEAIATAVELCQKLGKTPIVVHDCTGFLVNRIFIMGANEIMWLLQEGAPFESLEKMMLDFGMPMSPFVLADEVGNDTGYKAAKTFEKAYGERMKTPKITELMYEQKLFGKKSGKGFYIYNGKDKKRNPEIEKLLNNPTPLKISQSDMRDRVMLAMINESSRCLQEKIVNEPATLDMALIMGIGFPPFRGGLLKYTDELGIDYVANKLKELQTTHGARFEPSELILDMQRNNKKFFPKV